MPRLVWHRGERQVAQRDDPAGKQSWGGARVVWQVRQALPSSLRSGARLPHATRVLEAFHIERLGLAAVDDVRRRGNKRRSAVAGTATTRSTRPTHPAPQVRDAHRPCVDPARAPPGRRRSQPAADAGLNARRGAPPALTAQPRPGRRPAPVVAGPEPLRPAPSSPSCCAWRAPGQLDTRAARRLHIGKGVSNGPTEAVNAPITKIKKDRARLPQLENCRLRLLLATGVDWRTGTWQAAPATPIRERAPRSVVYNSLRASAINSARIIKTRGHLPNDGALGKLLDPGCKEWARRPYASNSAVLLCSTTAKSAGVGRAGSACLSRCGAFSNTPGRSVRSRTCRSPRHLLIVSCAVTVPVRPLAFRQTCC
jgi:hypothetical protein